MSPGWFDGGEDGRSRANVRGWVDVIAPDGDGSMRVNQDRPSTPGGWSPHSNRKRTSVGGMRLGVNTIDTIVDTGADAGTTLVIRIGTGLMNSISNVHV